MAPINRPSSSNSQLIEKLENLSQSIVDLKLTLIDMVRREVDLQIKPLLEAHQRTVERVLALEEQSRKGMQWANDEHTKLHTQIVQEGRDIRDGIIEEGKQIRSAMLAELKETRDKQQIETSGIYEYIKKKEEKEDQDKAEKKKEGRAHLMQLGFVTLSSVLGFLSALIILYISLHH